MKKSILILAEDIAASNLLKLVLTPVGFHVQTIFESTKAVDAIEVYKPDIVLIDVQSLKDGLSVCREIRDHYAMEELPIVLLANCTYQQEEKVSHAAGVNTHLYKPMSRHELINKIELILTEKFAYV